MKQIIAGILAHVDAGKTTLSEGLLYQSGMIRKMGRVDHQSTALDYEQNERDRGITIFSKQAYLDYQGNRIYFVDTPGHIDFASEMERSLAVLDYAILVLSGSEGIQSHTQTIWRLLKQHQIPVFLFVNKMDISHRTSSECMEELQKQFGDGFVNFSQKEDVIHEEVAMLQEDALNEYMESASLAETTIQNLIYERHLFPVFFGSALKMDGVEPFLNGFVKYSKERYYPDEFGARVYKITHEDGVRYTHVKVTGGSLNAKQKLDEEEKIDQIRIYMGNKYELVQSASAGSLCVIKGLKQFQVGDGMGFEQRHYQEMLAPAMCYRLLSPSHVDPFAMMRQLQLLKEEDPSLHIEYHEARKEIRFQIMGEVQLEILTAMIKERFDVDVSFDEGMVRYKETILEPIEGVGHYEPLRHYAEVHLLLEPLPEGSGLVFESLCPLDQLDRHWQRLVLSHLLEKTHVGVLSGSPITDMKISLLSGRGHLKHTEGGDFRQATYRAVRHGLARATSVLLEPMYQFVLKLPATSLSRALYDLETRHATFEIRDQNDEMMEIVGRVPVACFRNYEMMLRSYTNGKGILQCQLDGYAPCHNEGEVLAQIGYDFLSDMENPCSSIFCAYGAGYVVEYEQVEEQMHLPFTYGVESVSSITTHRQRNISDKEVERVMNSLFAKKEEPKRPGKKKIIPKEKTYHSPHANQHKPECVLVDGYNVIFSVDELKKIASEDMAAARDALLDLLHGNQAYRQCEMIVVFDAYKVGDASVKTYQDHKLHIVFTKRRQTADNYIESATHRLAKEFNVSVVTSDGLEQVIVIAQGANRISSNEFIQQVKQVHQQEITTYHTNTPRFRHEPLAELRKLNEDYCENK